MFQLWLVMFMDFSFIKVIKKKKNACSSFTVYYMFFHYRKTVIDQLSG